MDEERSKDRRCASERMLGGHQCHHIPTLPPWTDINHDGLVKLHQLGSHNQVAFHIAC